MENFRKILGKERGHIDVTFKFSSRDSKVLEIGKGRAY